MQLSVRRICQLLVGLILLGIALPADAQVFVYPRRPGQTNVRFDEFKWRHVNLFSSSKRDVETTDPGPRGGADPVGVRLYASNREMMPTYPPAYPASGRALDHPVLLASESSESGASEKRDESSRIERLTRKAGGLKFYFYQSERAVAERALAVVGEQYRDLTGRFDFGPPKTFPFILYNSYQEFLQTNLFPIQEGVLGVTSPRDLKLTLPYFGDHRQFERVARHELVHQFTIQKVRTIAGRHDTFRDPLEGIPLWFIEGLAEYYTHGGMDDETRMLVRDLAVHQAPQRRYVLGNFFDSGPRTYLWIYKVGQARCTFLEETYGSGTLQAILERSYRLGLGRWQKKRITNFRKLVGDVTGEKPKKISAKFESWLKEEAYQSYLDASQKHGDFPQLDKIDRYIQGLDASPDGNTLMYKTIDRSTGQNRIFLADRRDLSSEKRLVVDGHPRAASLHPLESGNFDIHRSEVAFIARARGRDVLYRQGYSVETEQKKKKKRDKSSKFDADYDIGTRTAYALREKGVYTAESPAFGPEGERIAFIGMDAEGQKDLFVLTPEGDDFTLTRLTNDVYAERGLDWGEDRLVFASDETGHGRYNLFEIEPRRGAEATRLTSAPTDQLEPAVLPSGKVLFVAYDDARSNLYEVRENGSVVRKTDVTTGLFGPSPGPNGGAWALFHHAGRRVPVQLNAKRLGTYQKSEPTPDVPAGGFETFSLDRSRKYRPLAPKNWGLNNGFGILGITASGVYGQLYASASDRLRNHRLLLDFIALGSFSRTDGALTYMNQENRIIWGASIFQDFLYRVDETLSEVPDFLSFERFYGGRGLLRYPFNQFNYLQFALAAGGTTYFLPRGTSRRLRRNSPGDDPDQLENRWQRINDSPRFQTEAQVSYGFDTINYQRQTGPLSGSSLLASVTGDYQPFHDTVFGSARIDGETYLPIYDRVNLFFRLGGGSSFGGRLARQFFLSSFYTLRGIPFRNRLLLGRNFGYTTLEFQFPLNFLIRIPFIDLEGIVGTDFGGVGNTPRDVWRKRVFDVAAGVNFGFGPIVLRLHFAKPFDTGGAVLPNDGDIVPNLSLGWRYL